MQLVTTVVHMELLALVLAAAWIKLLEHSNVMPLSQ